MGHDQREKRHVTDSSYSSSTTNRDGSAGTACRGSGSLHSAHRHLRIGRGLVLIADLPGVSVKSLELQVQNNKLTLLGRVTNPVPANARLVHKEYEEGDFLRSFILSEDVDHERVTARLNDGVLEIFLPRAAETTPRRIDVNTD